MNNKWNKYKRETKNYSSVFMSYDSEVKSNVSNKNRNSWFVKKMIEEARTDARDNASGNNANFCCKECGVWYNLSFGVYGKRVNNVFGDCEYFCRDCVKMMKRGTFVKM